MLQSTDLNPVQYFKITNLQNIYSCVLTFNKLRDFFSTMFFTSISVLIVVPLNSSYQGDQGFFYNIPYNSSSFYLQPNSKATSAFVDICQNNAMLQSIKICTSFLLLFIIAYSWIPGIRMPVSGCIWWVIINCIIS